MSLRKALQTKDFVVTAELYPPRGTGTTEYLKKAQVLKGIADGVNVTDNQLAMMRMAPLGFSALLVKEGIDPIMQMALRDRNTMAMQSDVLAAHALGIRNMLVITGDPVREDNPIQPKAVFELDLVSVLKMIRRLNEGFDHWGGELQGATDITIGAAANPGAWDLEVELSKTKAKMDAGAQFFQTQLVFDADQFLRFMDKIRPTGAKVLCGVFPLRSHKGALKMNEILGVKVPDALLKRMESSKNPEEDGLDAAAELIQNVKDACAGVHLMTMNRVEVIPELLERAGVLSKTI